MGNQDIEPEELVSFLWKGGLQVQGLDMWDKQGLLVTGFEFSSQWNKQGAEAWIWREIVPHFDRVPRSVKGEGVEISLVYADDKPGWFGAVVKIPGVSPQYRDRVLAAAALGTAEFKERYTLNGVFNQRVDDEIERDAEVQRLRGLYKALDSQAGALGEELARRGKVPLGGVRGLGIRRELRGVGEQRKVIGFQLIARLDELREERRGLREEFLYVAGGREI